MNWDSANEVRKPNAVQVMMNWGPGMTNDVKIPSVISYSPPIRDQRQFGADLSSDAVAMVNTKLELDVQGTRSEELDLIIQVLDGMKGLSFEHIKQSKSMPEYTWKTPEDVVTDYLTKAFEAFWEATEYMTEMRSIAPIDIVITIPVVSLLLEETVVRLMRSRTGHTGHAIRLSRRFATQASTNTIFLD